MKKLGKTAVRIINTLAAGEWMKAADFTKPERAAIRRLEKKRLVKRTKSDDGIVFTLTVAGQKHRDLEVGRLADEVGNDEVEPTTEVEAASTTDAVPVKRKRSPLGPLAAKVHKLLKKGSATTAELAEKTGEEKRRVLNALTKLEKDLENTDWSLANTGRDKKATWSII